MAASHNFKVYTPNNEYIASFKYVGDAANFATIFANGGTVRWGHAKKHTCFTAGRDDFDGYDAIAAAAEDLLFKHGIDFDGSWLTKDIEQINKVNIEGFNHD